RPVKNWNAGKAQEFKDRRTYRVEGLASRPVTDFQEEKNAVSVEDQPEALVVSVSETKADTKETNSSILLFKTPTCPNCKAAAALLDKAGVDYRVLNANEERELVEKYGIKQAPTLVVNEGGSFEKYRGVSDIKGWLMRS
ncbi:MAG TPA: ribonucleoside triphosphate reductase, partial [Erysipelotrichaceae bacterium]|nr:ribonucleoside triphosphate reductase [Erysipelotrichaceae bacterium]